MFYSQFILAKKGPLGTIWIAAHLERKLRKNQVADTDIGVSVDSILFPEVPIALRLSSHLLLGVVRIYSRKVNYLFDDCSEALLKVKQAFRSTAVDLPPEESTAPYHSITLPETFDLDDFELPDNDIFQGNYVDHHVSAREQITLQDTMEGVVYSTSQFGLDERFGDGDTSGLDLDEELFLEKVAAAAAASEHAGDMLGSGADPQASDQPMDPLKQDENCEDMTDNSEPMRAIGSVNQIEVPTENTDFIEYAQAPCTPGLLEEPNLSNIQEASACDDHMESEDHNITEFAAKENLESATSKVDFSYGNKNEMDGSHNDMNPEFVLRMPAEENGCLSDAQKVRQLEPLGDFPSTSVNIKHVSSKDPQSASLLSSIIADPDRVISPLSEFSDRIIATTDAANKVEDLQNGVASNDDPGIHSIDGVHLDCLEPQEVRLDEIEASPCLSREAHVMLDSCGNPGSGNENTIGKSNLISTCQPVSEGILETNQAPLTPDVSNNLEVAGNVEKPSPHNDVVVLDTESSSRHNIENSETWTCQGQKDTENYSSNVHEEMAFTPTHVLQPCNSHLNQFNMSPGGINSVVIDFPSEEVGLCLLETSGRKEANHTSEASNEVQGEGCQATDVIKPVLEGNSIAEPGSNEPIQENFSVLDNQVDKVTSRNTQLENLDSSELPAPEKFLSVPEGFDDLPNNFLLESTPHKAFLMGDDGSGDGIKSISGKKRSFTESTLTMQSLNSVKSFEVDLSKGTGESIPDDDDLLSSILVGRKSSALKVKFTAPPENETTSMKRPRSAPRVSSKRKVLLDDNMVLHGDTIRQQLTSTEDIRRVRKKAPCTRPEIWMIRKQLLEDEIFRESIFIGSSTELESLHSQTYDLSEIRVSQNDEKNTSLEAANDTAFSTELIVTEETGMEGSTEPMVGRNDGEAVPAETSVRILDQQGLEHVVNSQDCDTQAQLKAVSDLPDPRSSQQELLGEIAEMEIDGVCVSVADVVDHVIAPGVEPSSSRDPVSGDKFDISAGSTVQLASLDINYGADVFLQLHPSGVLPDQMLEMQHQEMDAEKHYDNVAVVETESSAINQFLLEEADGCASVEIPDKIHTDCSVLNNSADPFLTVSSPETGGCHNQVVVTVDHALQEISKNKEEEVNEDEVLAAELDNYDKNPSANGNCGEEPKIDSAYTSELIEDVKNAPLNDGESGCQQADSESRMDAETSAIDHTANEDHGDFDYAMDGHDTEFLNVDDDEVAEEDDNYMTSAIETRFLENSGWSSRTRAVAKYLQTLFDKEAEHGRKALPMDNLLAGKTRKEASRMFFEALVLKTRDYIHVEQGTPFDNINIKPRVKLMKSDF